MSDTSTLSTGKYVIDLVAGATQVFTIDEGGNKEWIASTTDPKRAMEIVEGLIMVETKRFYHPQTTPEVTSTSAKPVPPFLRKVNEAR